MSKGRCNAAGRVHGEGGEEHVHCAVAPRTRFYLEFLGVPHIVGKPGLSSLMLCYFYGIINESYSTVR